MKPLYAFSEAPKRFRSIFDDFSDISVLPIPIGTKPYTKQEPNGGTTGNSTKIEKTLSTKTKYTNFKGKEQFDESANGNKYKEKVKKLFFLLNFFAVINCQY